MKEQLFWLKCDLCVSVSSVHMCVFVYGVHPVLLDILMFSSAEVNIHLYPLCPSDRKLCGPEQAPAIALHTLQEPARFIWLRQL